MLLFSASPVYVRSATLFIILVLLVSFLYPIGNSLWLYALVTGTLLLIGSFISEWLLMRFRHLLNFRRTSSLDALQSMDLTASTIQSNVSTLLPLIRYLDAAEHLNSKQTSRSTSEASKIDSFADHPDFSVFASNKLHLLAPHKEQLEWLHYRFPQTIISYIQSEAQSNRIQVLNQEMRNLSAKASSLLSNKTKEKAALHAQLKLRSDQVIELKLQQKSNQSFERSLDSICKVLENIVAILESSQTHIHLTASEIDATNALFTQLEQKKQALPY